MAKDISPLEKDVLKDITKYLKKINIGTVVRHSTGGFKAGNRFISAGIPGTSDLSLELHNSPVTVWIEVKRITGKPTQDQLDFLKRQQERGNPAFVAHSVDELRQLLEKHGILKGN